MPTAMAASLLLRCSAVRQVVAATAGVARSAPIAGRATHRRVPSSAVAAPLTAHPHPPRRTFASTPATSTASSKGTSTGALSVPMSPVVSSWMRPHTEGLLTPDELHQYFEEGWVIKRDVFDEAQLSRVIGSFEDLVGQVAARLKDGGKIENDHADADVYTRLTLLERDWPGAGVLLHKMGVLPDSFAELWASPQLLSAARQVLGPDLDGHPVWNLRCKTPTTEEATVPWHQDAGYLEKGSWDKLQLTAWVPLVDATLHNGCMQVLRGGHRAGAVAGHTSCWGSTWYIDLPLEEAARTLGVDPDVDLVTCEVPKGGVLFLNNLVPHRSLENYSDGIRWSLDLRWQRPGEDNGFYGLKDCIPMARGDDPGFKPDWAGWADVNRTELQMAEDAAVDPFDTTISGPWIGAWPLTNENKHTDQFKRDQAAGVDTAKGKA